MGESSQCNPNKLCNLDKEFYKYMREIKLIVPELNPKDREHLNRWLIKLTGTHALRRNDYLKFLLDHLSATGELDPLFSEPPNKYEDLVALDEALFGPRPDSETTKRAWRGERVAPMKKLTSKQLKAKYGTDRAAIHNCLKDLKDTDELTVQGLVALVRAHTKDEGAELTEVMLTELNEFRVAVDEYYDQQTRFISEKLAVDQADLKTDFAKQVATLTKERDLLINQLQERDATFDWERFRKEHKITSENKRKIKKLRREIGDRRRRNLRIWDTIEELTKFANGQDCAQSACNSNLNESMGLLDQDELSDTFLN